MGRNSFLDKWWKTIDKWMLITIISIAMIGVMLITSASPSIAHKIKLEPNYFIYRHITHLAISFLAIFVISHLNEIQIRYLSVIGFVISVLLLIVVLYLGTEIKGAHRWLRIFGISLQPSEFAKTFFIAFNAIILARNYRLKYLFSFLTYMLVVSLIISEPDFGMNIIITLIFINQLFLCGIHVRYIVLVGLLTICIAVIAYFTTPHINQRINNFLNPNLEGNFQVNRSLEAFKNGGLVGLGLGEGVVKSTIPDAHTDFIFAVAGEEFGGIFCSLIILLFLFLGIKSLSHILGSNNSFHIIIITGLITGIVMPALINIGVSLHFFPTKGIVLPLISYGGSSMLASSIGLGVLLSVTRIRFSS